MNPGDKKIFVTLFFSIFVTVTGVGIVIPLLPVYAHELGASGFYIGMIFGSFSLARTFFLPYFGRLSDRKGRKPLIVPALLAYATISLGFIVFKDIHALIALRFLQGIASAMLMPIIQAYIGDITPPGNEGFTMGLFNMSMFCGLSIGPFLGGFIHDRFSLQTSFTCMGLLALIGFFLSLLLLPPTHSEKYLRSGKSPVDWKKLISERDIASIFLFRFSHILCIGIIWAFLPLYAKIKYNASSSTIGILIMLGVLVSGALHVPMGYLADKIEKRWMVAAGGLIVAGAIFAFEWVPDLTGLIWASIFFGIGGGIAVPPLMAIGVLKGNETDSMGSVMAILTLAHSLGMLCGSLIGGLMMDVFELNAAFPLGAAVMTLTVVIFLFSTRTRKRLSDR
ncbi:MAG: MFS transporter [Deltaproteobacteria bacterium]|nr:MFS transporter [Deltaproteobacteria bacterium]